MALGSNVRNSRQYIADATRLLGDILTNVKQAPLYSTKAVGYTDQPDFLNTALSGQTNLMPQELLKSIKDIEQQLGRTKTFRWGPREIDIDIIFYVDQILEIPGLTIPHPAFRDRDFVLRPLADLNPDLIDPVTHKSVSDLLKAIRPAQRSIKNQKV